MGSLFPGILLETAHKMNSKNNLELVHWPCILFLISLLLFIFIVTTSQKPLVGYSMPSSFVRV